MISCHALIRMQQRGIKMQILEYILEFGEIAFDHRGATIYFFNKKSKSWAKSTVGNLPHQLIDHCSLTYLVENKHGNIITVGHRSRRMPRN